MRSPRDPSRTKAPTVNLSQLYFTFIAFSFISRCWETSVVLLIAQLTDNSLSVVALSGFLSSLGVFLLMPSIGTWLDNNDRLLAVSVGIISKLSFLAATYVLTAFLLSDNDRQHHFDSIYSSVYLIPILYACASLSFNMIQQSIEKDWLVVMSNGDPGWLTSTNSAMSQIDLAASALGPVITGLVMTAFSSCKSSILFLICNIVATAIMYLLLKNLYYSFPPLALPRASDVVVAISQTGPGQYRRLYTSEPSETTAAASISLNSNSNHSIDTEDPVTSPPLHEKLIHALSLKEFYSCTCVGVMMAYAFLFATVLSFGPLMMVYLRYAGMSDHWIGITRGLSSILGFLGAVAFPSTKAAIGIRRTGLVAIWYQCLNVCAAAVSCWFLSRHSAMLAVTILTLASRTGLWLYDLVARQIAQETIAENMRGKINGQWRSVTSFFDMAIYIIAVIVSDPQKFWILSTISALMVSVAAMTFTMSTSARTFSFMDYGAEYKLLRLAIQRDGRSVHDHYRMGRRLGSGSYATVYEGYPLRYTDGPGTGVVAIKVISKASVRVGDEATVLAEIQTMQSLNHPNIVKMYDHFEDDTHYYLILEKLCGGELFDRIGKKTKYNESEARELFLVILGAVKYLHDRGMVHRDIKPENLLMVDDHDDAQVKLADFGFAKVAAGFSLTTRIGSPFYMAPEIISNRNYGKPVDMWALGVVTYVLVRGRMPFPCDEQSTAILFEKIKKGDYSMKDAKWAKISAECKDCIRHLLTVNEHERFTVDQALAHPWISKCSRQLEEVDLDEQLAEFKVFNANRKFKAAVQTVIAMKRFAALGTAGTVNGNGQNGHSTPTSNDKCEDAVTNVA